MKNSNFLGVQIYIQEENNILSPQLENFYYNNNDNDNDNIDDFNDFSNFGNTESEFNKQEEYDGNKTKYYFSGRLEAYKGFANIIKHSEFNLKDVPSLKF
ncbi:hypothetical protein C1646_758073 [Rhizophagus diaphanus]|nr:hypothetical protein C1646_758073 [Rhizophagus diaphanus] [Rhizophagus sp. MUCL 43196]